MWIDHAEVDKVLYLLVSGQTKRRGALRLFQPNRVVVTRPSSNLTFNTNPWKSGRSGNPSDVPIAKNQILKVQKSEVDRWIDGETGGSEART